jgi:hypothetical protein
MVMFLNILNNNNTHHWSNTTHKGNSIPKGKKTETTSSRKVVYDAQKILEVSLIISDRSLSKGQRYGNSHALQSNWTLFNSMCSLL